MRLSTQKSHALGVHRREIGGAKTRITTKKKKIKTEEVLEEKKAKNLSNEKEVNIAMMGLKGRTELDRSETK